MIDDPTLPSRPHEVNNIKDYEFSGRTSVTQDRASGRLTSGSEDMAAFTKALAVVTSKKRNVTSTAG